MKTGIGIDLGGTQVKGMAFDLEMGAEQCRLTEPTRDGEQVGKTPAWAEAVRRVLHGLEDHLGGPANVVGLSAPGLADRAHRCIRFMPGRLEGLEDFTWGDFLDRPMAVLNDAHAALMGEVWQGAARGVDDVFMLTLGTGVGGAIVSGGRLLTGHIGRAGHLGHISIRPDGAPDICGTPGSLEDALGECTIEQRSQGGFTSTRSLVESAQAGDSLAQEVWKRTMRDLAVGVNGLINVLDPEIIVIGGGISNAGDALWEPFQKELDRLEWRPAQHRVAIRPAILGEWAGCHGAVHFANDLKTAS